MATITFADKNGKTVLSYVGANTITDFILGAPEGEYAFTIDQGEVEQHGSFTVIAGKTSNLDSNQRGMLNYITKRAKVRRSELTIHGRVLAEQLLDLGLVSRTDDQEYVLA